ncbi:MAG: hypothetical protein E7Z63_01145 [Thermoplasmata archaeon]|nr:hypothetical protein [Thermoplasmata archaeon]
MNDLDRIQLRKKFTQMDHALHELMDVIMGCDGSELERMLRVCAEKCVSTYNSFSDLAYNCKLFVGNYSALVHFAILGKRIKALYNFTAGSDGAELQGVGIEMAGDVLEAYEPLQELLNLITR